MPENPAPLPDFTRWPSFPFEGDLRVKKLAAPVDVEPPRSGEDAADCIACNTPDDAYIWVSERWRVRAMDRPTGLPMVLILECRSHLDLGDLPNLLAAELGVMTVRLERAIRSLDGVARVHVNRWGDGSAHLHMWFLARPYGQLQLRGTFLSLWDDILPRIPEQQWRENLAMVAAWLAEFGGRAIAEPPHIQWQSPSTFSTPTTASDAPPATDTRPTYDARPATDTRAAADIRPATGTRPDVDEVALHTDPHGAGASGDGGQARTADRGSDVERDGAGDPNWSAGLGEVGTPFADGDASHDERADESVADVGDGERDSSVADRPRAAVPRQLGHDAGSPVGDRDTEDRATVDQAGVREAEGSARP